MAPPRRDPSLDLSGKVLANLPPGPYHSEGDIEGDSDDDSVQVLDEAPEHMRRWSNRDDPIPVDSSEDEGGEGQDMNPLAGPADLRFGRDVDADQLNSEDDGLPLFNEYGLQPVNRRNAGIPGRRHDNDDRRNNRNNLIPQGEIPLRDPIPPPQPVPLHHRLPRPRRLLLSPDDDEDHFPFAERNPVGRDDWSDSDDDDYNLDQNPFERYPIAENPAQRPKKRRRVDFIIPRLIENGLVRRGRTPVPGGHISPVSDRDDGAHDTVIAGRVGAGPSSQPPEAAELLLEVIAILPDIDADWALENLCSELRNGSSNNISNEVIDRALGMDGGYPKAKAKGKEKQVEEGSNEGYRSLKYRKSKRTGREYLQLSALALENAFPKIPIPHIRSTFFSQAFLYAPSYFRLNEQSLMDKKPYSELKRARTGKNRLSQPTDVEELEEDELDENRYLSIRTDEGVKEFHLEKAFVEAYEAAQKAEAEDTLAKSKAREEALAAGLGIECGCCFGEEVCTDMVQCADGHLFCRECAVRHAETRLGEQQTSILCMDMSGCQAAFVVSELSRILSMKSVELYHRLKQSKELEEAQIAGLEACPNCPYAAVIENPYEKLFYCLNDTCKAVTCRRCKRPDHVPKTCEEMEADKKLDKRHAVEDAMSEALIRKCPKCAKPFIKESGCNKIYCQGCRTLSCYICGQAIPEGYAHFDQQPGVRRQGQAAGKCALWDSTEAEQEHDRILAARNAAQEQGRLEAAVQGVELVEGDLDVAMPERPGRPAARIAQGVGIQYMPDGYHRQLLRNAFPAAQPHDFIQPLAAPPPQPPRPPRAARGIAPAPAVNPVAPVAAIRDAPRGGDGEFHGIGPRPDLRGGRGVRAHPRAAVAFDLHPPVADVDGHRIGRRRNEQIPRIEPPRPRRNPIRAHADMELAHIQQIEPPRRHVARQQRLVQDILDQVDVQARPAVHAAQFEGRAAVAGAEDLAARWAQYGGRVHLLDLP